MSKFVRASKYRHVFGTANKKEQCYDNIKVSRNAWDTNLVKVNGRFISINLETSGGGQFQVISLADVGKLPQDYPVFAGHSAAVLDTDFNPFNDWIVASCGEDCKVMVWQVPVAFEKENVTTPLLTFNEHNRKVGHVLFHPTAENVLLSSGADLLLKLYDLQKGVQMQNIEGHPDIVNSLSWNYDGSLIATSSKDKKIRVLDPRANKVVQEGNAHAGVKGGRICWLGDSNQLVTTGFSKQSDRQYMLWDARNLSEALKTENLDTSSGVLIPHFDNDTKMLYLAGKGDGNIRYYEITEEEAKLFPLSEYKSSDPLRGLAFMPKRCLNVTDCEVARIYKVHPDKIEPISFKVPHQFQADIYPETVGEVASITSQDWFAGKDARPLLISLEKGFQPSQVKLFASNTSINSALSSNSQLADPLKNPTTEKEYQEAFHAARKENESLKNELAQRETRIRQLEVQLAAASTK